MKYRKKPVVIEAFQYDGDLKGSDGKYYVPAWAVEAFESGVMHYGSAADNTPPMNCILKHWRVGIMSALAILSFRVSRESCILASLIFS